jgi:hypothetical protein
MNQEAKGLAVLQVTRGTVRDLRVDRPRGHGGPSASCGGLSEKQPRTSSTAASIMDCLRWTREPSAPSWTVRHSSTDRPRTLCNKNPPTNGSNKRHARTREEHEKHLGCQAPRVPSAMHSWTVHQEDFCSPSPTSWRSNLPPLCPISRINQKIATKS